MANKNESSLLKLFRVITFLIYLYSIYFLHTTDPWINASEKYRQFGRFKYLTIWDLYLQFFFVTSLLINGLIKQESIQKGIDFLFYSIFLPISFVVASTFWVLYFIDQELILPKSMAVTYPPWLNHSTHTLVFFFTFVELFFGQHQRPGCNKKPLMVLNIFSLVYAVWLLYLALVKEIWVYPFLEILNWPQRILFMVGAGIINFPAYYMGIAFSPAPTKQSLSGKNKKRF